MTRPAEREFPIVAFADRFVLVEHFAGGEGATALLREKATDDEVVAKVLPAGVELIEGDLLASLEHPAIPAVRSMGRLQDGRSFVLRDFAPGTPLSEAMPRDSEAVLALAGEVLEVLAFVHLRSVLHLDLKPANLLRGADGRLRLLDFGLGARRGQGARGGTPFFAAPELWLGGRPDARSDLFSLGAILVAALWPGGRGPPLSRFLRSFPEQSFLAACGADLEDFPEPFRGFLPRCLARRPSRRFGDAREALEFLFGSAGRPVLSALRPDPIATLGKEIDQALAALADAEPVLVGGSDGDRQTLALHCLFSLADGVALAPEQDGLRVQRRGSGRAAREIEVPRLSVTAVGDHLRGALGLSPDASLAAARHVLAATPPWPTAVGDHLQRLVETGSIVPDGTRWSWPDAQAGRLHRRAPEGTPLPTPANLRAAAAAGRFEQAEALHRAALVARPGAPADRALRTAHAQGLLAAGDPMRALPLCPDLPIEHLQCLLDLGRLGEAERELARAQSAALDAAERRLLHRCTAQLALRRSDPAGACQELAALAPPRPPAEVIVLAAAMAATGQGTAAVAELDRLLEHLDAATDPFLRAAALTERFHALRTLGEAEQGRRGLEQARALLFTLGHARHAATAALNLGVLAKDRLDFGSAVEHLRQARSLYRHLRDDAGAATAEANLGIVALEAGDATAARRRLQDASAELQRLGNLDAAQIALLMLARAEALLGETGAARQTLLRVDTERSDRLRAEASRVRALLDRPAVPSAAPAAAGPPEPTAPADTDGDDPVSEPRGVSQELFRTFLAVNRRLGSESDLERAMAYLLEAAVTLTGGRRGYLLVSRPDGLRREFEAGDPSPGAQAFSRSLANRAMQMQRTMTDADARSDRELAEMPSIRNLETRSAICTPFQSSSGVAGAIYVEHPGRGGAFQDKDREHLEVLADQAAIAVDRMLREELLARQLQESHREVAVARHMAARDAPKMAGKSPQMAELRRQIDRMGGQDLPLLILGETGTGKELVARAIHDAGPRRKGPFVAENCSALPAELMERELFGHVQGAFTGADRDRPGLLELAHGGTLFLDEVGDMPPALQAKLLRALQEKVIRRIGDDHDRQVDVRILAATHRDLGAMIAAGTFREDLYYRLAAVELRVPPLRERDGDIDLLARHFLELQNCKHGQGRRLHDTALVALRRHAWPGNVRELEHVIARAFVMADDDVIGEVDVPAPAAGTEAQAEATPGAAWPVVTLAEAEKRTIAAALAACGGDKTAAAKTLGISRTAIYDKIKRHGIDG